MFLASFLVSRLSMLINDVSKCIFWACVVIVFCSVAIVDWTSVIISGRRLDTEEQSSFMKSERSVAISAWMVTSISITLASTILLLLLFIVSSCFPGSRHIQQCHPNVARASRCAEGVQLHKLGCSASVILTRMKQSTGPFQTQFPYSFGIVLCIVELPYLICFMYLCVMCIS